MDAKADVNALDEAASTTLMYAASSSKCDDESAMECMRVREAILFVGKRTDSGPISGLVGSGSQC